tara:strand:- start:691 stop:1113 length:423 start_codon:yes stop_codon:yes gene_type:complete
MKFSMNNGIIIIFEKNCIDTIEIQIFKLTFNKKIKICLVNNGNNEKIFKFLDTLKDSSECDISILNLRKEKTTMMAVKAGVRFLSNKNNINLIIYATPKSICNPKTIHKILKFFERDLKTKKDKRVLLRGVYSIQEAFEL